MRNCPGTVALALSSELVRLPFAAFSTWPWQTFWNITRQISCTRYLQARWVCCESDSAAPYMQETFSALQRRDENPFLTTKQCPSSAKYSTCSLRCVMGAGLGFNARHEIC